MWSRNSVMEEGVAEGERCGGAGGDAHQWRVRGCGQVKSEKLDAFLASRLWNSEKLDACILCNSEK